MLNGIADRQTGGLQIRPSGQLPLALPVGSGPAVELARAILRLVEEIAEICFAAAVAAMTLRDDNFLFETMSLRGATAWPFAAAGPVRIPLFGKLTLSPPMTSGWPQRHNLVAVGVHQPHQMVGPALERLCFLLPIAVPIVGALQLGH